MASTVCALPGCPELVREGRRGYCDAHVSHAILDMLEEITGQLDELNGRVRQLGESVDRAQRRRAAD